jgi:hypothetical protein
MRQLLCAHHRRRSAVRAGSAASLLAERARGKGCRPRRRWASRAEVRLARRRGGSVLEVVEEARQSIERLPRWRRLDTGSVCARGCYSRMGEELLGARFVVDLRTEDFRCTRASEIGGRLVFAIHPGTEVWPIPSLIPCGTDFCLIDGLRTSWKCCNVLNCSFAVVFFCV